MSIKTCEYSNQYTAFDPNVLVLVHDFLYMFTITIYAVLIAIVRDQFIFTIAIYSDTMTAILRGQFQVIILCIHDRDAHGPDRGFASVGLCSRSRFTRS